MIRTSEHLPPVPKVRSKRVDEHGITPNQDVTPRFHVSVPQHFASPHPPPGSADEAHELDRERKIQPHDQVGAAGDEIAYLPLADVVDHPSGLVGERSLHL